MDRQTRLYDNFDRVEQKTIEEILNLVGLKITAFKVNHNIVCYGYSIEIDRLGRFDAAAAKAAEIPLKYWNRLQHGELECMDCSCQGCPMH